MYQPGGLRMTFPLCFSYEKEWGTCCCDHFGDHHIYDSRASKTVIHPAVYLPHSCDSWVIGGAKEIRNLIEELQLFLVKLQEEEKVPLDFLGEKK